MNDDEWGSSEFTQTNPGGGGEKSLKLDTLLKFKEVNMQ